MAHQSPIANLLTNLSELTGTLGRIQTFALEEHDEATATLPTEKAARLDQIFPQIFFKHAGETVKQLLLTALKGTVAKH